MVKVQFLSKISVLAKTLKMDESLKKNQIDFLVSNWFLDKNKLFGTVCQEQDAK